MSEKADIGTKGQDNTTKIVVQQADKQSWWSSLTPKQRKIISSTAIVLGISLVSVTAIYFGTKFIRGKIANVEENKSLGESDHASWAKQIKNAFDNNGWWGTDEVLLRKTLREIPSKVDFKKVQTSYRRLFQGANLVQDMTGELKQTEYDEMLAIINSKPATPRDAKKGIPMYDPHGWSKRLNAAMNYNWLGLFWGTDEDAIKAVILEMPTQQAFLDTSKVYYNSYGAGLISDLKGDLDSATMHIYSRMILRKPKQ